MNLLGSRIPSRNDLAKVAAIIALIIGVAIAFYLIFKHMGDDSDSNINQMSMVLSSSTVALIGVAITGYIFSSESLRKLSDDDYKYRHCAYNHKKTVFKLVIGLFLFAVFTIAYFFLAIYSDWGIISTEVDIIVLFFVFLVASILLYGKMMNIDKGLEKSAQILLESSRRDMKKDPIVHLNPIEYKNLVLDSGLSGHPDFISIPDRYGVNSNLIKAIRGKESDHYSRTEDDNDIIGYRDMVDEFDNETTLTVFESTEKIICRIAGVESTSVHKDEKKKLEASLDVGTGRKEDIGMLNDIVANYFLLSEFRDNLFVYYSDSEQSYTDPAKVDRTAIPPFDRRYCCSRMDFFETHKNMGRQLVSKHLKIKKQHEYAEYLRDMTPYVFVLRYALCKKLDGVDLSTMNLPGYDFSYGDLRRSILDGSLLMGAAFYCCNMEGAEIKKCDLTDVSFTNANCCDSSFTGSKLTGISFSGTALRGSKFNDALISDCGFPSSSGAGSSFSRASIINCRMNRCDFSNSDFSDSGFMNCSMTRCIFKNNDLSGSKIASCQINSCNYYGSDLSNSTINFCTFDNNTFMLSKLERIEMSSSIMKQNTFDNCQMMDCDLHGSQFFFCSFNSAQVTRCDFTRALILPFNMPEDDISTLMKFIKGDASVDKDDRDRALNKLNDFTNAFMKECLFTDAIIKCSNMKFAILQKSIFSHSIVGKCILNCCNLMESYIADSAFEYTSFFESTLEASNITSCKFEYCDFTKASLENVTVMSTTFDGCKLTGCNLSGCKMIDTTWRHSDLGHLVSDLKGYVDGINIGEGCVATLPDRTVSLDSKHYRDMKELMRENGIENGGANE